MVLTAHVLLVLLFKSLSENDEVDFTLSAEIFQLEQGEHCYHFQFVETYFKLCENSKQSPTHTVGLSLVNDPVS